MFKTLARSPAFLKKPGFFDRLSVLLRSFAFAGAILYLATTSGCAPTGTEEDHGRPVEQVAKDLGVTPEQFREAFKKVKPAPRGEQPTEAQREANRRVLSQELRVSPEKLDAVMDKYRPWDPRVQVGNSLGDSAGYRGRLPKSLQAPIDVVDCSRAASRAGGFIPWAEDRGDQPRGSS